MKGFIRLDGRIGIRNVIIVTYLVECAHHVARHIVNNAKNIDIQLIGFPGCYANPYALKMMQQLCTHPNVGGVLLLSLGCEGFNRGQLKDTIIESGRPVETLVIQESGGTRKTIESGQQILTKMVNQVSTVKRVDINISDLIIGTICGGSDGTSGIAANPSVGMCFDKLVKMGATCIFEETGELIGCEQVMSSRATTSELAQVLEKSISKAAKYYKVLGLGSFAPGNAEGGLTTQEEKSIGAYAKSGESSIVGLIKPGDVPPTGGLYLLDIVPDGEVRFGFPNISDNAEIVELIASGCHIILFTTGRGSVVGSAISPTIKICGNPKTYQHLSEDMDINAGLIIEGKASIEQIGEDIFNMICRVAEGEQSKSEALGHQEFILTYKSFDPIGPSCLPCS